MITLPITTTTTIYNISLRYFSNMAKASHLWRSPGIPKHIFNAWVQYTDQYRRSYGNSSRISRRTGYRTRRTSREQTPQFKAMVTIAPNMQWPLLSSRSTLRKNTEGADSSWRELIVNDCVRYHRAVGSSTTSTNARSEC